MSETCMFDIMELPNESLRKVLPKVSIRIVSRLVAGYPRAVGRTLLTVMSESMSPSTLSFLKDEMNSTSRPSMHQILDAEKEFIRTLREEKLLPAPAKEPIPAA